MPNQGNQGNKDPEDTTPTGTSGRQWPGENENWQQGSNEGITPPADENTRRRNHDEDEDSGLGNRNTFR
jgi:hypothetical protein